MATNQGFGDQVFDAVVTTIRNLPSPRQWNWKRILMGIIAGSLIVVGLACCFSGGGLLILGGALITGGFFGFNVVFGVLNFLLFLTLIRPTGVCWTQTTLACQIVRILLDIEQNLGRIMFNLHNFYLEWRIGMKKQYICVKR